MAKNPLDAYKNIEQATLSGRELEASVLTKAAKALLDVQASWDEPGLDERLDEALRLNQRIWTFFQAEVSSVDSPLPDQVKANLIELSIFIDKRIFDVMAYPERDKLSVLIRINSDIAAGLRGEEG